ncbi:metallophosphoesterase [Mesorhizobium sp. ANAO-SY3R2]|uniref:metallophosphoesterase n=1 Tax=Mesorhizobium sp. ANAO-SY3R2 TaxID=3166644 RepID=UPI003671CD76
MLMLHISDIHFRSPECLDPWMDPHAPIRTRMMRDLGEQVKALGEVGAILIGGDVAFKAAPDEYEAARVWIQQLSQISGCPKERIFVVPGNHDVDRGMIASNVSIQNVQHAIVTTERTWRDNRFRAQLADAVSGQSLFRPHAAYNDFAAPFGCQIWPAKPFWHQDIPLGDNINLRIYGLTSTLFSGQNGKNDKPGDLFLSAMQTVLDPAPNTANLVLVHHPIDWLSDGDEVDDALSTRAAIHLFGHKHKQRAVLEANYVRLGAGAVNPSREEKPYDPGYNLIRLEVAGKGADRVLKVELHQRKLQANPELFVPIKTAKNEDIFRTSISIPEEAAIPAAAVGGIVEPAVVAPVVEEGRIVVQDAEAAMGEVDTRDLLYRFWNLSSSQRREIIQRLGLLEAGEMKLPEPERYGRALIRAGERNLMNEVAAAVAKLEN